MRKFTIICVVIVMVCVVGILMTTWWAALTGDASSKDLLTLTGSVMTPTVLGGALFGYKPEIATAIQRLGKQNGQ